jgi:hypothetical protein
MKVRKEWGGELAVLACLAVVMAALTLPSCGGGGGSGGGCGANPAGPGCTPATTTPPPPVTRVVTQGSDTLESETIGGVVFTTTATGTIGLEVNWTFASNDVDIYLARGNDPCTDDTFENRSCFIASEESTSMKPEKLSVPNLAAGVYTLYVANFGDTDESVAWQVTLTSASAGSVSAATRTGLRSVKKAPAKGILEPR